MKAVFLDFATMGPNLDLSPLRALFDDLDVHDHTDAGTIGSRIRDAEFVFTNKMQLRGPVLVEALRLRFIGLTATGTDNIDLDAARRQGVAVANIRGYCTNSVVEHVFGALLMLTRNLGRYDTLVRAGQWRAAPEFCMLTYPIRELSSLTLGIVGYGTLGQGVARTARSLGMDVLVAARRGEPASDGRTPFEEVLASADVITLHCPLTDDTRNLFDSAAFATMRPGSILVNTARGGLVDAAALVAALETGRLSGAAVDVLRQEPPVDGDPILEYSGSNLIVTPHIAWGSDVARQNAIDELAANVAAFLRGEARNRVC